jgi:hypothetical protein
MDTRILELLEEYFNEEFSLVRHDLAALEALVKEKMQLLGQGLLQRTVNSDPNGYKGSSIACECGGSMKFVQHRPRDIHTLFGWIRIERAYYHCPDCKKSVFPYDVASGLGTEQLSPGLSKACCLVAVDDSFEQVSRKIEQFFAQKVSANTVERLTHQVGTVALRESDEQLANFRKSRDIPESSVKPKRLYVSADGTTVHETDGWHESKAGVIHWEDERKVRNSRHLGRFDNSETFGWHLWLESCRCGLRDAQEVVFLGDGAPWIRNERRKHFGRSTFIIDWYHADKHIWDCGKALFGEGTEMTENWVKERSGLLWDGWTKKLLDDLKEQYKKRRGSKRQALSQLIRYISDNEEQMRYDVFRDKGYDIGSGMVESACNYVIGKRLKQSGMIWSRKGSSSILALRVIWLNERWEQLWQKKPLAA